MQWLPRLFRARPGPTAWAHLAPLRRTLASEIRGKEVTHDELAHSLFAPNPEWVGRLKDEGIAPEDAVAVLAPFVSAQRKERMKHIAQRRNSHIACVLEVQVLSDAATALAHGCWGEGHERAGRGGVCVGGGGGGGEYIDIGARYNCEER